MSFVCLVPSTKESESLDEVIDILKMDNIFAPKVFHAGKSYTIDKFSKLHAGATLDVNNVNRVSQTDQTILIVVLQQVCPTWT